MKVGHIKDAVALLRQPPKHVEAIPWSSDDPPF
jgi:hypothetical protein